LSIEKILTCITPPFYIEPALGILHGEKDDNHAQSDASVECSRQNVIVSHPPSEVEAADTVVEDESDQGPRRVIDSTARGDGPNTCKENWNIDVSPE
jgi:hypothetical protein